jgi:hypothetical protein
MLTSGDIDLSMKGKWTVGNKHNCSGETDRNNKIVLTILKIVLTILKSAKPKNRGSD